MSTSSSLNDHSRSALAYVWGKYREYAINSRKRKAEISGWRLRVLLLGISGAILGTLCQETMRLGLDKATDWSCWVPPVLGWSSAAAIGFATFFGKEIVNPDQERQWIRSRSMAEALKAEIVLFLSRVHPYNNDEKAQALMAKSDELLVAVNDLQTESIDEQEKQKRLPAAFLTIEQYIEERVTEQIDNFYRPRSDELIRKMKKNKKIGIFLGMASVILGAFGASGWTAGWIAVISTIAASIAAFSYAGRYQYLIVSYQATANKLERLRTQWVVSGKSDADTEERDKFIRECEDVISIENSAWMAELSKTKKPKNE
jgi:hypothetical protein